MLSGRSQFDFALLAGFGEAIGDPVRQRDWQGHQLRRVIAGVAEHQALVARTHVLTRHGVLVHALSNVRTLAIEGHHDRAGLRVDAHVVVRVTDLLDHAADDVLIIDRGFRRDFTRNNGYTRGDHRLTGNPAVRILLKQGIQNTVGNLVRQLVRMAHADRFTRKQVLALRHGNLLLCGLRKEPLGKSLSRVLKVLADKPPIIAGVATREQDDEPPKLPTTHQGLTC